MAEIDFLAEAIPPTFSDEQLKMVSSLADRQVEIEKYIAKCEENLEKAKANWRNIAEKELPNAMQEIGMSKFTLSNGTSIEIKPELYASIPKDNKAPAFAWLREHDLDGVIKNVVSVQFSKGEDAKALELAEKLAMDGLLPQQEQSVHPQTLKALLKEQINKGVEVPLEKFGGYSVNRAKVTLPKKS